ncbi:hypothetical protein TNCV_1288971 [Trichonephila clavipes]|nr:hypothetical protein TNCV_1288971 [Trichonephila clavipes]
MEKNERVNSSSMVKFPHSNGFLKLAVAKCNCLSLKERPFTVFSGRGKPSGQEESNPVDDEMDEDEDNNNNESCKSPSNADAFSALETAME